MNEYQKCIVQAIERLVQFDGELVETQPKEECINHKLAQYLEQALCEKNLLHDCHVDIEYDKYEEDEKKISDGRNIRPDIIAHQRRSGNKNNLVVIEAKKGYGSKKDRDKVTHLVSDHGYRYSVGAVVSYLPGKPHTRIEFFTRTGGWKKYRFDKDSARITETKR